MNITVRPDYLRVPGVSFPEKLMRSLALIRDAHEHFGDRLVVECSLTRDSCVVWELAKRVSPGIRGFCVVTPFHSVEDVQFMHELVARYPEITLYESPAQVRDELPQLGAYLHCSTVQDSPTFSALDKLKDACLVGGFRHAQGLDRFDFREYQKVAKCLFTLTPILAWNEGEVSQYVASRRIPLSPPPEQRPRAVAFSARPRPQCEQNGIQAVVAVNHAVSV